MAIDAAYGQNEPPTKWLDPSQISALIKYKTFVVDVARGFANGSSEGECPTILIPVKDDLAAG